MSVVKRRYNSGFTLIELLVVLVIMTVVSSMVGMGINIQSRQLKRADSQLLKTTLQNAQQQAKLLNQIVVVQVQEQGQAGLTLRLCSINSPEQSTFQQLLNPDTEMDINFEANESLLDQSLNSEIIAPIANGCNPIKDSETHFKKSANIAVQYSTNTNTSFMQTQSQFQVLPQNAWVVMMHPSGKTMPAQFQLLEMDQQTRIGNPINLSRYGRFSTESEANANGRI